MSHYQHLLDQLKQLRLGGLLDTLEVRLKEAEKRQLAYPGLCKRSESE